MYYISIIKNSSILIDYTTYSENFHEIVIKSYIANNKHITIDFFALPLSNQYKNYEVYYLKHNEYAYNCVVASNMKEADEVLLVLQRIKQQVAEILLKEKDGFMIKALSYLKSVYEGYQINNKISNKKESISKLSVVEKEINEIKNEKQELLNKMIDKELALDDIQKKSSMLMNMSYESRYLAKKGYNKNRNNRLFGLILVVSIIFVLVCLFAYLFLI